MKCTILAVDDSKKGIVELFNVHGECLSCTAPFVVLSSQRSCIQVQQTMHKCVKQNAQKWNSRKAFVGPTVEVSLVGLHAQTRNCLLYNIKQIATLLRCYCFSPVFHQSDYNYLQTVGAGELYLDSQSVSKDIHISDNMARLYTGRN